MKEDIYKLRIEVESTLRFLYSAIAFHEALVNEKKVEQLNQNPDFWRIFESSMLANVFIGLRRLYEGKKKTFNFQSFIEKCILNIEEFSIEKINQRKSNAGISSFTGATYNVSENDFKAMSRLVRSNSKNMKGIYTNVASKVYAHAIHFSHGEAINSDQNLNLYEIEKALLSIWHCYEQIWQLYHNGREPTYRTHSYPYKQEVLDGVNRQIDA